MRRRSVRSPSNRMTATSTLSAQTDRTLTADEVAGQGKDLTAQWKDSVRTAYDEFYKNRILTDDPYFMILHWSILGEKPADGYALYISLHGGGGAPSKFNDMQWMGHQGLYRPYNAVYLCPRGITDTWDMHFRPEDDAFYKQIVMMMVAFCDVNPDKVYIMGYSAGGDGVWRMAPRMADHWAAASMMAGEEGCGFVGERFRKSQAAPPPCSKYSRGVMPNSLLKHAEK